MMADFGWKANVWREAGLFKIELYQNLNAF